MAASCPRISKFVLMTAPEGHLHVADFRPTTSSSRRTFPFSSSRPICEIEPPGFDRYRRIRAHRRAEDRSQLGLTGYAVQMLPLANQALVNDDPLGAAMVAGVVDQKSAQQRL